MTNDTQDLFYIKALVLSVENIPLPDGDAGKREAQAHEAVPQRIRLSAFNIKRPNMQIEIEANLSDNLDGSG